MLKRVILLPVEFDPNLLLDHAKDKAKAIALSLQALGLNQKHNNIFLSLLGEDLEKLAKQEGSIEEQLNFIEELCPSKAYSIGDKEDFFSSLSTRKTDAWVLSFEDNILSIYDYFLCLGKGHKEWPCRDVIQEAIAFWIEPIL